MVPLHRGRFVVVHLYSSFSVDPQACPLGANLYQKVPFLAILGAVCLLFYRHNGRILRDSVDLGLPLSRQIL